MAIKNAAVEFINDEISHLPETGINNYYDGIEEPDVFQKVRAFCETGGAPEALRLYRTVPNSKKENFIVDIDAQDFSPGFIKERYGGGDYIIKAYDANSKISLKQHLSIEGEPVIQAKSQILGASQPGPHAQQLDIGALMQAMQESNRQLLAGLMQVMAPQQHSRADMLSELAQMRDIFGQPAPQQSSIDPMTMLIKGIELAGSMAPKAGGETSGMDVLLESIKSFAPAIGAVVAQSAAQTAPVRERQIQPQQPQRQALTASPQIETQPTTEDNETMMFKYYVGMLVGFAAENRDPALYADLIADNLPENKVHELLSNPDVIGMLGDINPGVLTHRIWFESVITELRLIFGLTEPVNKINVVAPITQMTPDNVPGSDTKNGDNGYLTGNS